VQVEGSLAGFSVQLPLETGLTANSVRIPIAKQIYLSRNDPMKSPRKQLCSALSFTPSVFVYGSLVSGLHTGVNLSGDFWQLMRLPVSARTMAPDRACLAARPSSSNIRK
jgi:hypothetical protein